jgi:hypothetical protein
MCPHGYPKSIRLIKCLKSVGFYRRPPELATHPIAPMHRCCRPRRTPARRSRSVVRSRRPGAVPLCCPSGPSRLSAPSLQDASAGISSSGACVRSLPGARSLRRAVRFPRSPACGPKCLMSTPLATAGLNRFVGRANRFGGASGLS